MSSRLLAPAAPPLAASPMSSWPPGLYTRGVRITDVVARWRLAPALCPTTVLAHVLRRDVGGALQSLTEVDATTLRVLVAKGWDDTRWPATVVIEHGRVCVRLLAPAIDEARSALHCLLRRLAPEYAWVTVVSMQTGAPVRAPKGHPAYQSPWQRAWRACRRARWSGWGRA